jgi:ATP-dependent Lon protease
LSDVSDSVLRLSPILVVGNAGVGKSEFFLTFADMLKTRIEIINVSNIQTGSCLTGSESYWGNSQPGSLFELLVNGEIGNPLIILDEIDKSRDDDSYKPLAALHQLLEPRQARNFFDLSIPDLHFDASYVAWVATANTLETIGQPILDRFTVFQIDEPSKDQMIAIIKNQYSKFINDHPAGGYFEALPRTDVVEALSSYHPRKARKILEQCFGLAALEKRTYLTAHDVYACNIVKKDTTFNTGIGFLAPI